jgi:glyceraldehyde 3-phosphate dehydrogenase
MKTKIAINGFGRIGRNAFKIAFERPDLEVVALNDLTDTKTLAYLLKHDSAYGEYQHDVGSDDQNIIVNGQPIKVLAEKDPAALPWKDMGVDVVIESTGFFVDPDKAKAHITAGAKRVIISAPAKGDNADSADTIVLGGNEEKLKDGTEVISNASCTTNCITPVAAVVEHAFGIEKLMMTTIHSYTASQKLQDAPSAKHLRDGRAAAENIVPTTTGASIAAAKAFPVLKDVFGGFEVRVPTPVVSLADFVIVTKRAVTIEEVNEAFKKAAADPYYQGILAVTEEELVSTDFIGNSHSAIVDLPLTNVVGGNLLKVVAWYDNEWGYSNRLVELTADIGKHIGDPGVKHIDSEEAMTPTPPRPMPDDKPAEEPKHEEMLEAPKPEDFLPAPQVGQENKEPHDVKDAHQPIEGDERLSPDGPTDHQPGPPAVFPENPAGGPEEHRF